MNSNHAMVVSRSPDGGYIASMCWACDKATPGKVCEGPFETKSEAKAAAWAHRQLWDAPTDEMRAERLELQLRNRAEEVNSGNIPLHDMEAPTPCPRCGSVYLRFKRETADKWAFGVLALATKKKAHCARCGHKRWQD